MLNMLFSIDILWLDRNAVVLKVESNAEPCSSAFSCPVYRSPDNARYVLELNAGSAKKLGIRKGSRFILYPIKAYATKRER